MKPLILIGPMGVGKTTLGKKLAKKLGFRFCDTDKLIEQEHGPIATIFASSGESKFRDLEHEALSSAVEHYEVIATGGGVVTNPDNFQVLRSGYVVYLSTTGKHMKARLIAGKRPLLKNGYSDWERIYAERKQSYRDLSDVEFSITGASLKGLMTSIAEAYEKGKNA